MVFYLIGGCKGFLVFGELDATIVASVLAYRIIPLLPFVV
jgi:hypothetical protein